MSLSLRDKLVLAFLGLLLFSFALTGTILWRGVQQYTDKLTIAQLTLAASLLRQPIQRALINTPSEPPAALAPELEARVRVFSGVVLLLTSQDGDRVIFASQDLGISRLPINNPPRGAAAASPPPWILPQCFTSKGQTYACVAQPAQHEIARLFNYAPSSATVKNAIFVQARGSVQAEAARSLLAQMTGAAAAAVIVALTIALVVVRYITRPLLRMTAASEAMAGGDYNQHVPLTSGDEVGQLARSFNKMTVEVQRARQAQREFVANISHDLKTPLTSIIGFSQLLADSGEEQRVRQRAVQVINQEARRMQRMTEDLLELARLEAGQLPLQRQCLNLTSLLGEIFGRYTTLRPRPDVQLHDRRVPGPLPVSADPDRLTQVVVNLLDNAIKFCGPDGQVELVSSHDETEACFWIANSGDGLAPEEVAQVFNRFYRTDHARAFVEGGTGLGLAIVRELVMAHGGRVWAESEQGSWVRFVVALPLCLDA